jgi:hypothetical protein
MARVVQHASDGCFARRAQRDPAAQTYWQKPVVVLHVPAQHCAFVVHPWPAAWHEFAPQKSAMH